MRRYRGLSVIFLLPAALGSEEVRGVNFTAPLPWGSLPPCTWDGLNSLTL